MDAKELCFTLVNPPSLVSRKPPQILLTVTPRDQTELWKSQAPISWKIFNINSRENSQYSCTWNPFSMSVRAELGHSKNLLPNPNIVAEGGCYLELKGRPHHQWLKRKLWYGDKNTIVAINDSTIPCNINLGFLDVRAKHTPLLQLPQLQHQEGIILGEPILLQAYLVSGYEEHQTLDMSDMRHHLFSAEDGTPQPIDLSTLSEKTTFRLVATRYSLQMDTEEVGARLTLVHGSAQSISAHMRSENSLTMKASPMHSQDARLSEQVDAARPSDDSNIPAEGVPTTRVFGLIRQCTSLLQSYEQLASHSAFGSVAVPALKVGLGEGSLTKEVSQTSPAERSGNVQDGNARSAGQSSKPTQIPAASHGLDASVLSNVMGHLANFSPRSPEKLAVRSPLSPLMEDGGPLERRNSTSQSAHISSRRTRSTNGTSDSVLPGASRNTTGFSGSGFQTTSSTSNTLNGHPHLGIINSAPLTAPLAPNPMTMPRTFSQSDHQSETSAFGAAGFQGHRLSSSASRSQRESQDNAMDRFHVRQDSFETVSGSSRRDSVTSVSSASSFYSGDEPYTGALDQASQTADCKIARFSFTEGNAPPYGAEIIIPSTDVQETASYQPKMSAIGKDTHGAFGQYPRVDSTITAFRMGSVTHNISSSKDTTSPRRHPTLPSLNRSPNGFGYYRGGGSPSRTSVDSQMSPKSGRNLDSGVESHYSRHSSSQLSNSVTPRASVPHIYSGSQHSATFDSQYIAMHADQDTLHSLDGSPDPTSANSASTMKFHQSSAQNNSATSTSRPHPVPLQLPTPVSSEQRVSRVTSTSFVQDVSAPRPRPSSQGGANSNDTNTVGHGSHFITARSFHHHSQGGGRAEVHVAEASGSANGTSSQQVGARSIAAGQHILGKSEVKRNAGWGASSSSRNIGTKAISSWRLNKGSRASRVNVTRRSMTGLSGSSQHSRRSGSKTVSSRLSERSHSSDDAESNQSASGYRSPKFVETGEYITGSEASHLSQDDREFSEDGHSYMDSARSKESQLPVEGSDLPGHGDWAYEHHRFLQSLDERRSSAYSGSVNGTESDFVEEAHFARGTDAHFGRAVSESSEAVALPEAPASPRHISEGSTGLDDLLVVDRIAMDEDETPQANTPLPTSSNGAAFVEENSEVRLATLEGNEVAVGIQPGETDEAASSNSDLNLALRQTSGVESTGSEGSTASTSGLYTSNLSGESSLQTSVVQWSGDSSGTLTTSTPTPASVELVSSTHTVLSQPHSTFTSSHLTANSVDSASKTVSSTSRTVSTSYVQLPAPKPVGFLRKFAKSVMGSSSSSGKANTAIVVTETTETTAESSSVNALTSVLTNEHVTVVGNDRKDTTGSMQRDNSDLLNVQHSSQAKIGALNARTSGGEQEPLVISKPPELPPRKLRGSETHTTPPPASTPEESQQVEVIPATIKSPPSLAVASPLPKASDLEQEDAFESQGGDVSAKVVAVTSIGNSAITVNSHHALVTEAALLPIESTTDDPPLTQVPLHDSLSGLPDTSNESVTHITLERSSDISGEEENQWYSQRSGLSHEVTAQTDLSVRYEGQGAFAKFGVGEHQGKNQSDQGSMRVTHGATREYHSQITNNSHSNDELSESDSETDEEDSQRGTRRKLSITRVTTITTTEEVVSPELRSTRTRKTSLASGAPTRPPLPPRQLTASGAAQSSSTSSHKSFETSHVFSSSHVSTTLPPLPMRPAKVTKPLVNVNGIESAQYASILEVPESDDSEDLPVFGLDPEAADGPTTIVHDTFNTSDAEQPNALTVLLSPIHEISEHTLAGDTRESVIEVMVDPKSYLEPTSPAPKPSPMAAQATSNEDEAKQMPISPARSVASLSPGEPEAIEPLSPLDGHDAMYRSEGDAARYSAEEQASEGTLASSSSLLKSATSEYSNSPKPNGRDISLSQVNFTTEIVAEIPEDRSHRTNPQALAGLGDWDSSSLMGPAARLESQSLLTTAPKVEVKSPTQRSLWGFGKVVPGLAANVEVTTLVVDESYRSSAEEKVETSPSAQNETSISSKTLENASGTVEPIVIVKETIVHHVVHDFSDADIFDIISLAKVTLDASAGMRWPGDPNTYTIPEHERWEVDAVERKDLRVRDRETEQEYTIAMVRMLAASFDIVKEIQSEKAQRVKRLPTSSAIASPRPESPAGTNTPINPPSTPRATTFKFKAKMPRFGAPW